jgi:tetratricopeptide (TPR) repeat protein
VESKILAEPVLVGREQELKQLHHCLDQARRGRGTAVFISGEAGTGKTRLVSGFLNSAKQANNVVTLMGWCLYNAGVPYFPFIEAFSAYFSSLDKKNGAELELNSWLKGSSRTSASGANVYLSPQALKDQTFAAVYKAMFSISTDKPTILFIDDVHWADSASLALLHYLARTIESQRVLVIATYRSEELTVDEAGHPHPLVEGLRLMSRENLFEKIELKNLGPNDVLSLAESMVGGRLEPEFFRKLASESQGNPLFVVESLRMLAEKGSLVNEDNRWHLCGNELSIPAKVQDIIMHRVGNLKPSQRKLLDLASVVGSTFDPELLASVIGQSSVEVLETLSSIAQSSSLVIPEGNAYRFDHMKSRDAVYGEIPTPLRRAYHGQVAEKMEANRKDEKPPAADLVYHYAQAGNREKAVEFALVAGQEALAKWSNQQAIEHFEYVLKNVSEGQVEERRTALEGLGDAYAANYMYAEAIKTFDKLAASESGLVRLRAIRKAMDAAFLKGDKPDLLLDYAKKAEELASCDRLEMARVLENRGRAFAWAGRGNLEVDIADYEAALKVFEEENSLADVAEALGRAGDARTFFEGLRKKGLDELLLSNAIFRELGDARKDVEGTMHLGLAFSRGLLIEARQELAKVIAVGDKLSAFAELARAYGILSTLEEDDGKLAEALSYTLKALKYYEKIDANYIQGLEVAALTRLYSKLGDLKHADEYFGRLAKVSPVILSNPMVGSLILISKGVYFAAKGQWDESNQAFEDIAKSRWKGYEGYYAWALERQGRFAEAKAQRSRVQKRVNQIEERFRHAGLQTSFLMPRTINVGEGVEMRLYAVNVGRRSAVLVKVEGLVPSGCEVVSMPPFCSIHHSSVDLGQKTVGAFQVEPIKFRIVFAKPGVYDLQPCLSYLSDLKEIQTSRPEVVTVNAQFGSSKIKLGTGEEPPCRFEFKSEAAEKAFNFLVSAFEEDYFRRRLPQEKSGWRTLMDIVKNAQVTMHSVYGRCGRGGKATIELGQLGLIESRFFAGERGRGGSILKLRICYQKEAIKDRLNQQQKS